MRDASDDIVMTRLIVAFDRDGEPWGLAVDMRGTPPLGHIGNMAAEIDHALTLQFGAPPPDRSWHIYQVTL